MSNTMSPAAKYMHSMYLFRRLSTGEGIKTHIDRGRFVLGKGRTDETEWSSDRMSNVQAALEQRERVELSLSMG
jgi:hypothetical protein